MEPKFILDYRSGEAAASRRILNRAVHRGVGGWRPHSAILVPAALYLVFAIYTDWSGWLGVYSLPAVVAVGIVVLMYIRFAAPRINQQMFARALGLTAMEGRRISYEFSDEGYRIRTEHFDGFQKWSGVERIVDEGGMVLIVLGPNAHFLPRRLFSSTLQRREFIAWAVSRLNPAARRRSGFR